MHCHHESFLHEHRHQINGSFEISTAIATEIENESLEIFWILHQFFLCECHGIVAKLIDGEDANIADRRCLDLRLYTRNVNILARDRHRKRFELTFSYDRECDLGSFGPTNLENNFFQFHSRYFRAVYLGDDVSWEQSCFFRR